MHIVFLTTELAPVNPGGAGSVVAGLRDLLVARGDRVSVILIADTNGTVPEGVIVAESSSGFEQRADSAARTLQSFVGEDPPDLIEFQDFDGLGFSLLAHRAEIGIDRIPTQVRFHGPADLMFEAIGVEPREIAIARSMESSSFRMADRVVVPSVGIGQLVQARYGVEPERIVVGQPPLPGNRTFHRSPAKTPTLLCVGRLGEVKGTHDLVAAAIPLLRERTDARVVIVGEDGWSATARKPMREWLIDDLIPEDIVDQVELTGRLDGDLLDEQLARAWALVVPSRFESFNLAAHEARAAGIPVIVPDLPAFVGLLDAETGALVYDGTRSGMTVAMRAIIGDESLRDRLAHAPRPPYSDPLEPYRRLPTVRHPRSQAGLATMAVQRLERVQPEEIEDASPEPDTRSFPRRTGYAFLMALPEPAARTTVAAIPAGWRERFGFVADWRDEMRRREMLADEAAKAARMLAERTALDERVSAGAFPDLEEPLVSIVIPCHNDGAYLDSSIRSVFNQTMTSFEVIVVDDGSTDPETIATLDHLPWSRTRVIRQENRGLSAARNAGMGVARGRYVVPLDVDDELEHRYLEIMAETLEARPDAAFATCRARLFQDIDAIWIPRPYNPYQLLLSNSIVGCVLLRRDAYLSVGGYDETMRHGNEDWDLWIRLMKAGWGVAEVPDVLFRYRKHGISMSVETEARFERGRAEIVDRHREMYNRESLKVMKSTLYPLVSIIVPAEADPETFAAQDVDDAEIITLAGASARFREIAEVRSWQAREAPTVEDAARSAIGKFIIYWNEVSDTEPNTISRLADLLESDPDLGSAVTRDPHPLTMVRRWSLLDPGAPSSTRILDLGGTGAEQLQPGAFPDPNWIVPETIQDVPVQRQRPEEEGHVPSWSID